MPATKEAIALAGARLHARHPGVHFSSDADRQICGKSQIKNIS
jgi:hypothetical protein